MPAAYSLSIYRGDSFALRVTLWQDTEQTEATDLTGVIPKAEIRVAPGGPLLAAFVCTITEPNIIDVTLAPEVTQTLGAAGVWDLQLTYPSGDVGTILAGGVTVTPDVTDSAALGWAAPPVLVS